MAGLCEGGNEPAGSLKATATEITTDLAAMQVKKVRKPTLDKLMNSHMLHVANLLEKRFGSEWQQDDRLRLYANVLNSGATEEEAEEDYCETGQFINPHDEGNV
ncbi:hypothetical protein ANN_22285 [Periplaneta americana]|uniref:Uncharacterized protein n=1 Tax=Periplaneta americana TaxID=6978 RepID=A0ABQ8S7T0_PERAM|nr:hypothetical protein ANN_22285 [Periplaneta americana]